MSKPRKKPAKADAELSFPHRRMLAGQAYDEQLTRVASILISQGGAYLSSIPEVDCKLNVKQLTNQHRQQFARLQKLAQAVVDLDAEAAEGRG